MNHKIINLGNSLLLSGTFFMLFASCQEEEAAGKITPTVYNLCFEQAQNIYSNLTPNCNVVNSKIMADGQSFTYDLNMTFTMSQIPSENVSAKVSIDKDTLQTSIDKAGTNSIYDIYKDAKIVPEGVYSLSGTDLTMEKDRTRSNSIRLTVNTDKLLEEVQASDTTDATYVLPLRLTDASAYALDSKRRTLMFIFKIHDGKSEPAFKADGEGVANNDTLAGGYKLLWHDEFNGTGSPNSAMWRFEEGFQRNEEDQWYSKNNAEMRDNALVFTARQERVKNPNYNPNATGGNSWKQTREYAEYTSACIVAQPEYAFKYGKVVVRAKIPVQQGAWPAIWSTGNKYEWPLNGEIDIMEFYKEKIHANVCWGGDSRWNGSWNSKNKLLSDFIKNDPYWAEKYHVWTMDWDEKYIRLYLDDELLNETNLDNTYNKGDHGAGAGGSINPYRNDIERFGQLMMLNLAVGGINGRPVQATFPFTYNVDYIRVYQK